MKFLHGPMFLILAYLAFSVPNVGAAGAALDRSPEEIKADRAKWAAVRMTEMDACQGNQLVLNGALNMYCSDGKLTPEDRAKLVADADLMAQLIVNRYMQRVPVDPGSGAGSWSAYKLVGGQTFACLRHGCLTERLHLPVPPRSEKPPATPGMTVDRKFADSLQSLAEEKP